MAPKEEMQVEAHIDSALRRYTFLPLEVLLQKESSSQKCSKEFLLKIDKLICRELQKNKVKNVSLVLNVIYKYANCLTTDGEEWLTTVIKQGIVEKIRDLLVHAGNVKNEALLTLSEDYFDVVMVVHDHNSDGQIQVLEHFISRTCSLVSDTNINTFIKQEAVRKLNLLLDTVPREARKKLIFTKEMMSTMSSMGKRILDAGDYDLQVAITEALCRMTSEAQREELASNWFPMEFITDAFKKIKDADFETDCRKFLNLVNGMLGDKRRVFTFPCLSAYLDNHKLRIPSDEKLEEFWIDFNVGTQSISFYVSTDNNSEDHQWETVCLTTSEVDMYNLEAIGNERLLTVNLNTPVIVGQKRGTQIRIYFDSALDISDIARKVFSTNKFKDFTKKQSVSVAKTAVHIVFDESGSQIVIPESQGSIRSSKSVTAVNASDVNKKTQTPLSTPCHNVQTSHVSSGQNHAKLVTPSRNKVSEASVNITITGGFKAGNPSASTSTPTLEKARIKPPLKIVSSAERSTFIAPNKKDSTNCTKQTNFQKQSYTAADIGNMQSEADIGSIPKGDEQTEIVPGTQFTCVKNSSLSACLTERYLGLNKKYSDSTRQNERISIPNELICENEKGASNDIVKQQSCHAVFENEKCPQNTKTTLASNQKTKLQPQETKTTNKKNGLRTETKERNFERHDRNIFSKLDTSLSTSVQNAEIHLDTSAKKPKPDYGWKGAGNIIKSKNLRDTAKQKNAEKEMDEKAKGLPDAARSLISKIGSKYSKEALKRKQEHTSVRQILNKNNCQTKKEKRQNKKIKPKGNKESSMGKGDEPWDDVYSFHSLGYDDPTIELGVSSLVLSEQLGNNTMSKAEKLSEKKHKNKIENEQKIKGTSTHLFSDTDNDRGGDDSKTDISWLRDPASKRKLNTFSYSRHRHVKQPEKTLLCKGQDVIKQRKKADQCKECDVNVDSEGAKDNAKQIKLKRPQRATAKRKNYKEHSESEEEPSPASRQENELQTIKKPLSIESQKKPENSSSKKHRKNPSKTEDKSVTSKMTKPVYKNIVSSPVCSSPDSIEQIRAEHSNTELPSRHETVAQYSPSLSASPPQATPKKFLNISASMKNISTHWSQCSDRSTHKIEKEHDVCESDQELSPPPSHLSMTTVNLDHSTISGVNILAIPEDKYNEQNLRTSSPIIAKTGIQAHQEKKDNSASFHSNVSRTSSSEVTHLNIHGSGVTLHNTRSYLKLFNNGSNQHEDIDTEGRSYEVKPKKLKLLPRRLFSSADKTEARVSGSVSTVSGNDLSTMDNDTWEGRDTNVDMMCQKISKEFTRKIQNRSRKMDCFTKQSLKSAQKHLTSMDVQVKECRIMHLEKFQQTVLEEIENFEKDSQTLKQMEKEFTNFWNKQTQTLNLYHKNEQRRIHCLKASFEKNVSHSTDYEDKIYNSEMHIMKENMKIVQERLLKEMQEEELLSVRRGLRSLFMTGAGPF